MKYDRKYPQWFIDELVSDHDKLMAINGTLSTNTIVEFKCEKHDIIYRQRVKSHITLSTGEKKYGCPLCGKENQKKNKCNTTDNKRIFPQWFIDALVENEDKTNAREYKLKWNDRVKLKCENCGCVYEQIVNRCLKLSDGAKLSQLCKSCSSEKRVINHKHSLSSKRLYPQWFIDELVNEEDKERAKVGLLTTLELAEFICEHGHTYKQQVRDHIILKTGERKYGCPECKTISNNIHLSLLHKEYGKTNIIKRIETLNSKRIYPEWFINELAYEEDKIKARNGELTSNDVISFRCVNGHVFERVIHCHYRQSDSSRVHGCPICNESYFRSNTEIEIENYINSLNLTTEHKIFNFNGKKFEIDIFIPDLNIGIEYNGSYYHKSLPNDGISKDKYYHQDKWKFFRDIKIRLVSIYDVDWNFNSDKIKLFFRNMFSKHDRIYARNCNIKVIDINQSNELYGDYHLLGKLSTSDVDYGLFYNEELISCMSFQKNRYKDCWCLCRFVTKGDITVVGGAGKLLKQFIRDYDPDKIISFSDNDYFAGNVYEKLGFTCLGCISSPMYYWYLNGKEIKMESFQLSKLMKKYPDIYEDSLQQKDILNKEDYIMTTLGAYKIYRSGTTKWLWRK